MNKNPHLIWGAITFISFLIFTLTVASGILTKFDYSATVYTQSLVPRIFDTPFSIFSLIGTAEITGIILLLVLFIFRKTKTAVWVILLFIIVGIIEVAGKSFINHPAPPAEFLRTSLSFGFPTHVVAEVAEFFSYPSGHSARTAFISGFLILLVWLSQKLSKQTKVIIISGVLIFDFVMFFSRVYLGEHWLTDVVGGALLGFSLAFFTSYFLSLKSSK